MDIQHKPNENRFALLDAGKEIGEICYVPEGEGLLIANHTFVDDAYAGQGLAGQLLAALVDYARAQNLRIQPVCSYVVAAFERHPERYADVEAPHGN